MTEDTDPSPSDTDAAEDRLEAARELVGVEPMWSGRILHTAVELGLIAVLGDEPVSAEHVAAERDLDPDRTYRLLRAMAHFDVLAEDGAGRFTLTPLGEYFEADHPQSVRDDLRFNRSPEWTRAMLHMPDVVREGGPSGFVREFGREFFTYVRENPAFGDRYEAIMAYASRDHPDQILAALDTYDFSQFSHVCDVGGGRGRLLCHLLEATPHLRGTVLDLPSVVDDDGLWADRLGVEDRCTYVAGDMFETVPRADAYLLKWILHNFDDADCRRILSTVHEAAPPDGRLFVLETVLPGPGTAHYAKRLDMAMMVQVGGRERTEDEYATLLADAGWRHVETWVPEEGPLRILEAEPV